MGVKAGAVNVGNTATPLGVPGGTSERKIRIRNNGAGAIFVGDASVTTDTGYEIAAGAELVVDSTEGLPDAESIHLVAATSGSARWFAH